MPIYDYKCKHCGHQFEYFKLSMSPDAECPKCQSAELDQMVSIVAVSSDATRANSLASARKRASVIQKDKAHEEHKHLHEHYDHHH